MTSGKSTTTHAALAAFACIGLVGCATADIASHQDKGVKTAIEDPPARPGAKTLLIAMPESRDFVDARKGLVAEVEKDFNVTTFVTTPTTTVDELVATIERTSPVAIVLMNNTTLALFQKYQARNTAAHPIPPAVVLMTSFLEEVSSGMKHITGIAYEVPGVTGFIHLRAVVASPVNRVGVVYRPAFKRFVERQVALAARESIEIVPVAVPVDVSADQLREALNTLCQRGKVDALWMLNDNGLIRDAAFVMETWRSALRDVNLPLMVGVSNLVDPAEPFGALAVVPDHEALGLQAANLLFDLAGNNWNVGEHAIELPLSVKTVVDVKQVRDRFGLRAGALQQIDQALDP
jgi:hypothetical protein